MQNTMVKRVGEMAAGKKMRKKRRFGGLIKTGKEKRRKIIKKNREKGLKDASSWAKNEKKNRPARCKGGGMTKCTKLCTIYILKLSYLFCRQVGSRAA